MSFTYRYRFDPSGFYRVSKEEFDNNAGQLLLRQDLVPTAFIGSTSAYLTYGSDLYDENNIQFVDPSVVPQDGLFFTIGVTRYTANNSLRPGFSLYFRFEGVGYFTFTSPFDWVDDDEVDYQQGPNAWFLVVVDGILDAPTEIETVWDASLVAFYAEGTEPQEPVHECFWERLVSATQHCGAVEEEGPEPSPVLAQVDAVWNGENYVFTKSGPEPAMTDVVHAFSYMDEDVRRIDMDLGNEFAGDLADPDTHPISGAAGSRLTVQADGEWRLLIGNYNDASGREIVGGAGQTIIEMDPELLEVTDGSMSLSSLDPTTLDPGWVPDTVYLYWGRFVILQDDAAPPRISSLRVEVLGKDST